MRHIRIDTKDSINLTERYSGIYNKNIILESTSFIPINNGHVLLSDYVKEHIQTHNKVGVGSVFRNNVNIKDLENIISNINISGDGGLYTVKAPNIGYNLVLPINEAEELPNAQLTKVEKEERGSKVSVPAVKTSENIENFATDDLTFIIRPSNPDYLPDDAKTPDILDAVQQGQSYSVLTAFPGDPNIPPASEWNDRYAVILPST